MSQRCCWSTHNAMNTKSNSHFIFTRLETIHLVHSVPLSAQGRALPEFIAFATWLVLGLLYAYLAEEEWIKIAHAFQCPLSSNLR